MSFSAENFIQKLDGLQDTQDSIVSISQWVLFHHRYIEEITRVWCNYTITSSPSRKLPLLYLCNDIVQQAKHKRKPDLIKSFALVLPKVLEKIYGGLSDAIKAKVDRLLSVWDQRQVFLPEDLQAMSSAMSSATTNTSNGSIVHKPSASASASTNGHKEDIVPELRALNDLFKHMNQIIDISQSNLNQVGIQSVQYLPRDPMTADNLPGPKTYIRKLNTLEQLCIISSQNVDEIKNDRMNILNALDSLKNIIEEGLKTDESKKSNINQKLSKLHLMRNELQAVQAEEDESATDDTSTSSGSKPNNTTRSVIMKLANERHMNESNILGRSATFNQDQDSDLPVYEEDSNSDEDTEVVRPVKKQKKTPSSFKSSGNKKSVAFSDNIEIKEYDRDNQTEIIKIIKSDDDHDADDTDEYDYDGGLSEQGDYESSEYDPGSGSELSSTSVLDILSKLS